MLTIFQAVYTEARQHDHSIIAISPAVGAELSLAAVLILAAETDLRADYVEGVWALDASPGKGAFVRAAASPEQSAALWREGERKGGRVAAPCRQWLSELGYMADELAETERLSPGRALAFTYDFVEVHSSSPSLAAVAERRGLRVGPVIDLTISDLEVVGPPRLPRRRVRAVAARGRSRPSPLDGCAASRLAAGRRALGKGDPAAARDDGAAAAPAPVWGVLGPPQPADPPRRRHR